MDNEKKCWRCGANGAFDPLDRHHIFRGKNRKLSEKYGLVVYLCHAECHMLAQALEYEASVSKASHPGEV